MGTDARVVRFARRVAREAVREGAIAVVLSGSHARGDSHAHSDVDLIAIERRLTPESDRSGALVPCRVRGGMLIAMACETLATVRRGFRDPERATTWVPGWRQAIILEDPTGTARRLQREAERWTWDVIADVCDAHVARSITGLAEEAHKLAGLYAAGNMMAAAAQRSILAVWLAGVMAVRHRILFCTDNELWRLVGERMGARWRRTQSAALSLEGESLEASCRAALALFGLAAAEARPLLNRDQRAVVDVACALRLRVR